VREIQIITHGAKGVMVFGSEIKVLTHRAEGQNGFVRKTSVFTHGNKKTASKESDFFVLLRRGFVSVWNSV